MDLKGTRWCTGWRCSRTVRLELHGCWQIVERLARETGFECATSSLGKRPAVKNTTTWRSHQITQATSTQRVFTNLRARADKWSLYGVLTRRRSSPPRYGPSCLDENSIRFSVGNAPFG